VNFAYVRLLLATAFLILCLAGLLNYVVDPSRIYQKGEIDPQAYADALIKSPHGLWAPPDTFDERLIKKALAEYSGQFDAVIIGSSHCMSVSSVRKPRTLAGICDSLLNLGISGASIEDHLTMAFLSVKNRQPKKLFFSIDPWTFAYGKDTRWSAYRKDYYKARATIFEANNQNTPEYEMADSAKLVNLLNLEYTVRSARILFLGTRPSSQSIKLAPRFDYSIGGEFPVYLNDGSYIYSSKYIADCELTPIPVGGLTYKTDSPCNTKDGIDAYRSLLLWIKHKGVEPILLMTPYHENVWKAPLSLDSVAMRSTEIIVLNFARELNLRVVGSFDPAVAGCQPSDFYDCMHTKPEGLAKLKIRTIATQ